MTKGRKRNKVFIKKDKKAGRVKYNIIEALKKKGFPSVTGFRKASRK